MDVNMALDVKRKLDKMTIEVETFQRNFRQLRTEVNKLCDKCMDEDLSRKSQLKWVQWIKSKLFQIFQTKTKSTYSHDVRRSLLYASLNVAELKVAGGKFMKSLWNAISELYQDLFLANKIASSDPIKRKNFLPVLSLMNNKGFANSIQSLPLEMWGEVFKRLDNPKDVLNCADANRLWRELLRPSIVSLQFWECFPHLAKYLERNDIYNCGRVCQMWNQTIIKFMTTTASDSIDFSEQTNAVITVRMNTSEGILTLLNEQRQSNLQPFIGKSLSLKNSNREDTIYWSNVLELLRVYGENIWNCVIGIGDVQEEQLAALGESLSYLTNVKHLAVKNASSLVSYGVTSTDANGTGIADVIPTIDDVTIQAVNHFLQQHPLPELPHLEKLTLLYVPVVFQDYFLAKYGPQLKKIHLICNPTSSTKRAEYPCLEDLRISICGVSELLHNGWMTCRLKILRLTVVEHSNVDFAGIVLVANKFSMTLKEFELNFYILQSHKTSPQVTEMMNLQLPLVEKLEVNSYVGPIDFIIDMPALQSFKFSKRSNWRGSYDTPETQQQIQIYGYEERMYRSNIWDWIPSLKKVTICRSDYESNYREFVYSYSRSMYEYLLRKNIRI